MWAMLLLAGLLFMSACNGVQTGNTGATEPEPEQLQTESADTPSEAAEETETTESQVVNLVTFEYADSPFNKEWRVWDYIEEATGVQVNPSSAAANNPTEAYNAMVASRDLPDIMYMNSYAMANRYGEQGALQNFLDHLDRMPNFQQWMAKYKELSNNTLSADGKMYILPNEGNTSGSFILWMYREDIFAQHNIAAPKSFDDVYAVSKQLKALYPDSYPLSFRYGLGGLDSYFSLNFNTRGSVYYNYASEEWRYGPADDNYKSMVEFFKRMYDEKLIPPDWLTVDTNIWQQHISTSQSFLTMDYLGRINLFNEPMQRENPEFKLNWLPPLVGVDGVPTHYINPVLQHGYGLTTDAENQDAALKLLDWMYSEEGRQLLSWGKLGTDYTERDGVKKLNYKNVPDLRVNSGLNTLGTYLWTDPEAVLSMAVEDEKNTFLALQQYLEKVQPIPPLNPEEIEFVSVQGEAIKKAKEENIARFILGTRPLDEWDQYVGELKELGLDQFVAIYKTAHERATARP